GGYQVLLLDEDRGWLLVGGKDHIYLLKSDSLDLPTRTIYWPASPDHVEHCRQAGNSLEMDCANFVRVLQPFNKTHVYVYGELYSGTSVDFMGANAAIFRTSNDVGGKRSLINRWTTFLKARLVCSIPGPSGMDTVFHELQDIFVLETKDPQNPTIYGVFTTSSEVFRGSAVCVYSMASIRAAFNGPFAHKDGPDYRWLEFRGRIPYPRPGTCPSETYDALYRSTRDLPDDVVSFMRQHQLMWEPILPQDGRPVLTLSSAPYRLRKVVVDRVDTDEGPYDVLHLGTGEGEGGVALQVGR
ncbi:hypothetical protein CRUP_025984, partial [Coryphaenoides rupestris]